MDEKYRAMVKAILDDVAAKGVADHEAGIDASCSATAALIEGLARLVVLQPAGFVDTVVAELRELEEVSRASFGALLCERGVVRPDSQVH